MVNSMPVQKTKDASGAPSSFSQKSRKGKKAWRKNIDNTAVKEGLALKEEQLTQGGRIQDKPSQALFMIDTIGDASIKKDLPKASKPLRYLEALKSTSAVPALPGRLKKAPKNQHRSKESPQPTTVLEEANAHHYHIKPLSRAEKERLLRIGKRLRRGALNSYIDPTEFGQGSAASLLVTEADYDAWKAAVDQNQIEDESSLTGFEVPKPVPPQAPYTMSIDHAPHIPAAITAPHPGTSYNPAAESHAALLKIAVDVEVEREAARQKVADYKDLSRRVLHSVEEDKIMGMSLDPEETEKQADDEQIAAELIEAIESARSDPPRKTRQQRQKAQRQREMAKHLKDLKSIQKQGQEIFRLRQMKKEMTSKDAVLSVNRDLKKAKSIQTRLKQGLVGTKVGGRKVPESNIAVQLDDELAESLRTLKGEGNLWRSQWESMLARGRAEPRVPVRAKHRLATKLYEKHHYKRFV